VRAVYIVASHLLVLAAAPPLPAQELRHGYWYEPRAETADEKLLVEALVASAFEGSADRARALERIWATRPGTVVAGLARLEAGWKLLESNRYGESIAVLGHADLRLTALMDHVYLAQARAKRRLGDPLGAGALLVAAAVAGGDGPLVCPALIEGGMAYTEAGKPDSAADVLTRALLKCEEREAEIIYSLSQVRQKQQNAKEAALLLERLDRDHPASPENARAATLFSSLEPLLPTLTPSQKRNRTLTKALILFESRRYREAESLFRALRSSKRRGEEDDLVAVRLGRIWLALGRLSQARAIFGTVPRGSTYEAEAAYYRARACRSEKDRLADYELVAQCCSGTPWASEALTRLGAHYLLEGRADHAANYFRRLLSADGETPNARRATWHVAWFDWRNGRYADVARTLERGAQQWTDARETGGFLYWAARARLALGEKDRARELLSEAVRRFKHSYHGMRARELLGSLPGIAAAEAERPAFVRPMAVDASEEIPEAVRTRVRQLILIDRFAEAITELKSLPVSSGVEATIAWAEWRLGKLRDAINSMKRAYPEWIGESGDLLPEPVWRILYPLQFEEHIVSKADAYGLDPALVAALICQESTFQPDAVSRAGARGLMQIMPSTGRQIARAKGVRFRLTDLYDPATSLDFGLHYLREMSDTFGGRIERVLAAYNAGPHRVTQWTFERPDMSAEEFIESIPFTETRHYVAAVLANQAHYRRIYALGASTTADRVTGRTSP
jgi:soluble lytic murein transglycosylase